MKCQLCEKELQEENSYKSVFNRMCFECYHALVDPFWCPINYIDDGIYLGNQEAAVSEELIKENNIEAICVCGKNLQTAFEGSLQYKKYSIGDVSTEKISHLFEENNKWIDEMKKEGRNILIHCAGGVSRSVSFTIAYFMQKHKKSFQEAFLWVKKKRLCAQPNEGFVQQLLEFEKTLSA